VLRSGKKAAIDREGKQMMFLIRSAFWLTVIVLLIPTDGEQQQKLYGMAQTAVADIRGFCVRNPETCASGQVAVDALVQKAQYGAHMVHSLANGKPVTFPPSHVAGISQQTAADKPTSHEQQMNGAMMPLPSAVPIEPTPWIDSDSQNTLSPDDLKAEWGGPNV